MVRDYKQEFCNKNGDQKPNMTTQESEGLKKLQKRTAEDGLVIMKTDKSGKFSATTIDDYLRMGQEHTSKDKVISRVEIRKIEAVLNGHCRAWCKMWQSGKNHGHTKRIMVSKTTISNNVAKMWLALKDHKPGDKSRGIVTGCTSNTRGLSNSVSDVLEAVAINEKNPYEVNSGEDMLARVHASNEKTKARREEWLERRFDKIETECNCNIEKAGLVRDCEQHRYEHMTETRLG